jgi:hypothetical protein
MDQEESTSRVGRAVEVGVKCSAVRRDDDLFSSRLLEKVPKPDLARRNGQGQ